jgi:hypothetical protein
VKFLQLYYKRVGSTVYCAIVEQLAVIWFLSSEGVKHSKIQRRMLAKYIKNCVMQTKEGVATNGLRDSGMENKSRSLRPLGPSNHFPNGGQCGTS